MEKFLLFTTGGGSSDSLNWDSNEGALYNAKNLESIKPASARELDLLFNTISGTEIVTLKIKNGLHSRIISSIATAIGSGKNTIIAIADVDGGRYVNNNIYGVTLNKGSYNYIQTLTDNNRTKISVTKTNYTSCTIANIDGTDAVACTLELYDGTTYTKILDQVSIPAKVSLVLNRNEIAFNESIYDLYATSGDSGGQLTFTFNY